MKKLEIEDLLPYFNYSFSDIDWDYNQLSISEKDKISLETFESLKELFFKTDKNWIKKEFNKCKNNPYYFATTYLKMNNNNSCKIPYTTSLSEEEFNKYFS